MMSIDALVLSNVRFVDNPEVWPASDLNQRKIADALIAS
jgi:hypothetical protein